ncbi:hypothetical protein A4X17_18555 [Plantibacter sp. H53]|nr:hypothetical protein A4X17_18555 [Plantibacter sp. H53]
MTPVVPTVPATVITTATAASSTGSVITASAARSAEPTLADTGSAAGQLLPLAGLATVLGLLLLAGGAITRRRMS